MSLSATLWASRQLGLDAGTRWTLWWLADYAHDDGRYSFPSVDTLVVKSGQGRTTIKRHLRQLELDGYIVRGDQSVTRRFPTNRRPVVWDCNLTRGQGGRDLRNRSAAKALSTGYPQADGAGGPDRTPKSVRGSKSDPLGGPDWTPTLRTNPLAETSNQLEPQTARANWRPCLVCNRAEADCRLAESKVASELRHTYTPTPREA